MRKEALRNGKIVLSEQPLVLETPLEKLDSFITPTKSFYVRTHFPIPKIDKNKWRLRIEGEVEKPFEINYDDLIKLESQKIAVTLECAGNNRNFLQPKVKGVQWGLGGVGNAEWTGVPLSILLDRAGIKSSAREIILEGADHGTLEDPKSPRGEINFARSIPSAGTWLARTRDCSGLVRGRVDQMVTAHRCHRQTIQRLLSDTRLRVLEEARGGSRVNRAYRNAN